MRTEAGVYSDQHESPGAGRGITPYFSETLLEIELHPQLNDTWVARTVVFAKKLAQRARHVAGALAANVVRDDHLVIVIEDIAAGCVDGIAIGVHAGLHGQVDAAVDAAELRVVEDVEGLDAELQIAAAVFADGQVLEDGHIEIEIAGPSQIIARPGANATDRRDDNRAGVDVHTRRPSGRANLRIAIQIKACPVGVGTGQALLQA